MGSHATLHVKQDVSRHLIVSVRPQGIRNQIHHHCHHQTHRPCVSAGFAMVIFGAFTVFGPQERHHQPYMKVIALALRHFQFWIVQKQLVWENISYVNKSCGLFKVFENLYPPPNKNVRECQRHQPSRIGDSLRWRSCASCRATSNELAMCKLRMIFSGKGCNLVFRIFKSCEISLFWSYIIYINIHIFILVSF